MKPVIQTILLVLLCIALCFVKSCSSRSKSNLVRAKIKAVDKDYKGFKAIHFTLVNKHYEVGDTIEYQPTSLDGVELYVIEKKLPNESK